LNADGSERREYRPPEEVFSPASLASFRAAAVTDLHPSQRGDSAWVAPENWRRLAVGHIGEAVNHTDTHVMCDALIQDAEAIDLIEQGKRRELSCGYTCDYFDTPGVTADGERYDGIQKNIILNHVALLPPGAGRAGSSAALRLDAADLYQATETPKVKIVIDGREFEKGSDEHLAYVTDAANARAKAAEDKAAAEVKAAKERADAIEKAAKELPGRIARRKRFCEDIAIVRSAIETAGGRCDAPPPSEEPGDGKDEPGVIAAVLAELMPDFDTAGKDPVWLEGALMMLVHELKASAGPDTDAADDVGELDAGRTVDPGDAPMGPTAPPPARTDSRPRRTVDAYTRNLETTENLWKRPLAASRS